MNLQIKHSNDSSVEPLTLPKRWVVVALVLLLAGIVGLNLSGNDVLAHPTLILVVGSVIGVSVSLAVLTLAAATRVAEEMIYFAAETAHEAAGPGPNDLVEAASAMDSLLDYYNRLVQRRALTRFQWMFLSRFVRFHVALSGARDHLNPALRGTTQSLAPFRQAAAVLAHYCEAVRERVGGKFYGIAARLAGSDALSFEHANAALKEFHDRTQEFIKHPEPTAAKMACLASRRAGAVLHCLWPEYAQTMKPTQPELDEFANDLRLCREATTELADDCLGETGHSLREYSASLRRRFEALQALRKGDRPMLWKILNSASQNNGNDSKPAQEVPVPG